MSLILCHWFVCGNDLFVIWDWIACHWFIQLTADRALAHTVAHNLEIIGKKFRFSFRRSRIFMWFTMSTVLIHEHGAHLIYEWSCGSNHKLLWLDAPHISPLKVPTSFRGKFEFVFSPFGFVLKIFACTLPPGTLLILIEFKVIVPKLWQFVVFCTCRILPKGLEFGENFPPGHMCDEIWYV